MTDDFAWSVQVAGNLAYLADGLGVQVVEVTNPARPVGRRATELPGDTERIVLGGAQGIAVNVEMARI